MTSIARNITCGKECSKARKIAQVIRWQKLHPKKMCVVSVLDGFASCGTAHNSRWVLSKIKKKRGVCTSLQLLLLLRLVKVLSGSLWIPTRMQSLRKCLILSVSMKMPD